MRGPYAQEGCLSRTRTPPRGRFFRAAFKMQGENAASGPPVRPVLRFSYWVGVVHISLFCCQIGTLIEHFEKKEIGSNRLLGASCENSAAAYADEYSRVYEDYS